MAPCAAARARAVLLSRLRAGAARRLAAQNPAPEQLYESGALRAAAEGFSRRAAAEPAVAGHWYNLGATYYRLGAPGRAEAAWLRARRLDSARGIRAARPRAHAARRTLASSRWTWSPPVTPEELLLVGAIGWIARLARLGRCGRAPAIGGWSCSSSPVRGRRGGLALRAWYRRPLAIVARST